MKLIEYSTQWAKGEILEGVCILVVGFLALICSFLVWKFGSTFNAKALLIPVFVLGFLLSSMGGFMMYSNSNRINEFKTAYYSNPIEFINSEKTRVEEFQILYPISLGVSGLCFLLTLFAFLVSKSPTYHAIGIALSVFGAVLIVIDYFSKERAQIYYYNILNSL